MQYRLPWIGWLDAYAKRSLVGASEVSLQERRDRMNAVNPRFVLRNYIAQQAIDLAEQGEVHLVQELMNVLKTPYVDNPDHSRWYAIRPDWARHKAGCSMLSCSS